MKDKKYTLEPGNDAQLAEVVEELISDKGASELREVIIRSAASRSTAAQRALGWILCRELARQITNRADQVYTSEDVHDFTLSERYGATSIQLMGRTIVRPTQRFSSMRREEMVDYIDWLKRWAVDRGLSVQIPADSSYWQLARELGY